MEAGDRNTNFSHAITIARHCVNQITTIVANGRLWEKKVDIERDVYFFINYTQVREQIEASYEWGSFETTLSFKSVYP